VDADPYTGNVIVSWFDTRNDRDDGLPGDTDTDSVVNSEVQRTPRPASTAA
jgi:hypothetical protein